MKNSHHWLRWLPSSTYNKYIHKYFLQELQCSLTCFTNLLCLCFVMKFLLMLGAFHIAKYVEHCMGMFLWVSWLRTVIFGEKDLELALWEANFCQSSSRVAYTIICHWNCVENLRWRAFWEKRGLKLSCCYQKYWDTASVYVIKNAKGMSKNTSRVLKQCSSLLKTICKLHKLTSN